MFLMVARLNFRAFTMPERSPFTRVTPALSMATSVPVPMAIPTWAWARRGVAAHLMSLTWTCSRGIQLRCHLR